MQPRVRIGLAVAIGGIGLAVAVHTATRAPADPPVPAEAAEHHPAPQYKDLDEHNERALAGALQRVIGPPSEPEIKLPPAAARRVAEASFEGMMHTLEELADAEKRVPRARRDQLYRETNDVFSALSAQLDPNDAEDMQLLEDANIRMKAMLGELGVRVPKRLAPAE